MLRKYLAPAIGVLALVVPVGAVMYFKWNNPDGPGADGNGTEVARTIEVPMAAPEQAPPGQRRKERASIAGTVRDVDGAPIEGALVCAAASSSMLNASDVRWPSCARSGREGRYRVGDLAGVRHRVSAGAASFLPADYVYVEADVRRRAVDLRTGGEATGIDLTLARGGVEIRGVVEDLRGAPIADAWISSGGPESGTGIVWARSAANGQYTLWVRPGTVTVAAQAQGHLAGTTTGPTEGHTFTVSLAPEAVLRGTVIRASDRTPVEGARVRATPGGPSVATDGEGRFRLEALAWGAYQARAEMDDGFGMATEQVSLAPGETSVPLVIELKPAVFVEGRIVHADGAVCDDGAITLREQASGREAHDTTEPTGLVHLPGLLPGTYTVTVACVGAVAADHYPPIVVRGRDVGERVWEVGKGRAIAGVLVDASGEPVVGVTLHARPLGGAAELPAVVSDDQGRFALRGLVAGSYELLPVAHARRTMPDAPVLVKVGEVDVAGLRIALAATGEVRGTLRDPQKRPIVGAELTLKLGDSAQQATTGGDGGFRFAHAAAGSSAVTVRLGGAPLRVLAHARVAVRVGATTQVELVSEAPTGAISGVLRDGAGQPVADALVEARPEGTIPELARPGLWRVGGERPQFTDAAGNFALTGLAGDAYTVTAYRIGGGAARRQHVAPGETLALALATSGRVTGKVALPGGGAPDSFVVDLVEARTGERRSENFIGTAGVWGFGGLPHGEYTLHVRAREGEHSQPLVFASGDERSGVRVELVGATTVRGTVLDLAGLPVPDLVVESSMVRAVGSDTRYITDAAGQFELLRVPVGAVVITVGAASGGSTSYGVARIPLDIRPDQRVVDLPEIRVARRRIAVGEARGDLGFTVAGASLGDISRGLAGAGSAPTDLKVVSVRHDGPAARVGLRAHDEIVSVDGQDVRAANRSLFTTLTEVPAGTSVRLGLARGATVAVVATARR